MSDGCDTADQDERDTMIEELYQETEWSKSAVSHGAPVGLSRGSN
jgi:hypothetical protein